jgi:hypothetical protein
MFLYGRRLEDRAEFWMTYIINRGHIAKYSRIHESNIDFNQLLKKKIPKSG